MILNPNQRLLILDTETTGLDPKSGDRLVEIGVVELRGFSVGQSFQRYINPERDVPIEAEKVHGLSTKFLSKYQPFIAVIEDFLQFIGDDILVIHNAQFDMKFINFQLQECGFPAIPDKRVIDSLAEARKKFPGQPASLDALCRRFNIDNTSREFHGALLDAQLLCEVWIEMNGGRQNRLDLAEIGGAKNNNQTGQTGQAMLQQSERTHYPARQFAPSPEELLAHQEMLSKLKNPKWLL